MKKVSEMYRQEIVMFVHSHQGLLFSEEASLSDIRSMNDADLYNVAYQLEKEFENINSR